MSLVGFEPALPEIEWPQFDVLDRTDAGIGSTVSYLTFWRRNYFFLILAHSVYKM